MRKLGILVWIIFDLVMPDAPIYGEAVDYIQQKEAADPREFPPTSIGSRGRRMSINDHVVDTFRVNVLRLAGERNMTLSELSRIADVPEHLLTDPVPSQLYDHHLIRLACELSVPIASLFQR